MKEVATWQGEATGYAPIPDSDAYLQRRYLGKVLFYWMLLFALHCIYALEHNPSYGVGWAFFLATPALAIGLTVGFMLRSLHAALQVTILILQVEGGFVFFQIISERFSGTEWEPSLALTVKSLVLAFLCVPRILGARYAVGNDFRLLLGVAALLAGIFATWQSEKVHIYLVSFAGSFVSYEPPQRSFAQTLPTDKLWEAQPRLVDEATGVTEGAAKSETLYYLISVAVDGRDEFVREEAKLALDTFGRRYGDSVRMKVFLSNNAADALQSPLATVGNFDSVMARIADDNAPADSVIVVYLATSLTVGDTAITSMFDTGQLERFSAKRLNEALEKAGIARAIIVTSACYAGNWIEPLKNENRIIIASSAEYGKAFPCSSKRPKMIFSDAFLSRDLGNGLPLATVFGNARKNIRRTEEDLDQCQSDPQLSVGKNMHELWDGPTKFTATHSPCTSAPWP